MSSIKPKHHRQAVTTLTQSRSAIFAPTLRPIARTATVVVRTKWATATVSRVQLTQVHRDILDVLFTHFSPHYRADGSCAFIFAPHAVMRLLGHRGGVNLQWLRQKFGDMELAKLRVETAAYTIETSVVRKHAWTADGSRYAVVFESEYVSFFGRDLRVHSEALTGAILALTHAPTKALVRFVLSHRSWVGSMDATLDAIGCIGGERRRRATKARILSERPALERDFGIRFAGGYVRYDQHARVWFESPAAAS